MPRVETNDAELVVPREGAGRGVDGTFTRRPGLRRARGSLGTEVLIEKVARVNPGRIIGDAKPEVPPKPTEDETPWRSLVFVSAKHSADGNAYGRDQPIPEAEAVRQGQLNEVKAPRPVREACPHCETRGKVRQMKGHKPDCKCVGCRPCKVCGGSGYLEVS